MQFPGREGNPWDKIAPHEDLKRPGSHYLSILASGILSLAGLGFCVVYVSRGEDMPLPAVLLSVLCLTFIVYKCTARSWTHYATWVFKEGRQLDCAVDLVPSGELDHPFIIVQDANAMTHLYNTKVFAIQHGNIKNTGYDSRDPKHNCKHSAQAIYDQGRNGNAVVFIIAGHRFWCKAVPDRIS